MSATSVRQSNIANVVNSSSFASYKELIVERQERVLLIKFNRPSVKNALNRHAYYELIRALNEASNDEEVTIVAITGVGDTFSAGNDLSQTRDYADVKAFFRSANYVLRSLAKAFIFCPKVIVALVNGACIGVGFTLAALCDVVYCTENAYFQGPFTSLGICPEMGASHLLPLILGRSKASETLLFGEKLSSQEAAQYNFVAGVYRKESFDDLLHQKLQQYSQLPVNSLRATKRLLRTRDRQALLTAVEAECGELETLRRSEVYLNNLQKFTQKTKSKL